MANVKEVNLLKAAAEMIKLHGDGAILAASQRADAMLNTGNMEGYFVWNRIVAAIADLLRKTEQMRPPRPRVDE